MDHTGRGKSRPCLCHAGMWPLCDERENDELQPDQGARRRTHDHVEAVPFGEQGHFVLLIWASSVLHQRREVSKHLFWKSFVAFPLNARERNVGVAVRIGHAHRLFYLRVNRFAG